ncbi:MAG: hypothetical protein Q7S73_00765 [bacterium]|nr:hypothetical protein [bacterium]
MKKITVNKSDEVAIIVEKIIEAQDNELILSVPRFSHLGESLSNFHLLQREAEALDKKLLIESVDDHIIELAEMSGLTAANPFFSKNKRQFSDIVAPKETGPASRRKKPSIKIFREEGVDKKTEDEFSEMESDLDRPSFFKQKVARRFKFPEIKIPKLELPDTNFSKTYLWFGVFALAGLIFLMFGLQFFARAEVHIIAQKKQWLYNDSIITEKSAVLDQARMTIPNQIFSQKQNVQLKSPASGKRQVEKKATGMITVYNSYSSDPQPLVEQTRFLSPEGKLFRLTKKIIVPAAKIVEGKIVPSSIDTEVVADGAGPDYNIGPVKLFNIPGFKGTPKYQAFYGESKNNMAGGFIGEVAYPTADDIKNAKTKSRETLEAGLNNAIFSQIPKEFKILEGAKRFSVLSQKVDEEADGSGVFGIFSESELTVIAFKEEDLKNLLVQRAKKDNGEDFQVKSFKLEYGLARADFDKGRLSFPATYSAVLAKIINMETLKSDIMGKTEFELKSKIFSLPGLESATISLWPFWVKKVPESADKITITVD